MLPLALFLGFLVVPVLEIYVIIQVGQLIGGWPTVGLLLAESLLGAWIVRHEGRRAWRALTETFQRGTVPERELTDAGLVLVGGVLLLTPGFITDVAGFLFVLPFTRPLMRRLLSAYVGRRIRITQRRMEQSFPPGVGFPPRVDGEPYDTGGGGGRDNGPVIRGQVIREDKEP